MALAKLSIDLEARLATLQQDLDKANRLIGQQTDAMSARFAAVQRAATAVGAAFAGALSAGAVGAFVQRTVAGLAALKGLSEATGSSVENLSALESVALRSGTSVDAMGSALVRFNQELAKADKGTETAAILRQIGLEAEQLRQLDPAEALRRVSVALAGYADDGDRARIVQQLFGRNVREVAGFLRDLAEQQQLQATVSAAQVEEADRLAKHFAALSERAVQFSRTMAGPVVAALNEFFDVMQGRGPGKISEFLAVPMQAVTVLGGNVAFVLKAIGVEIGGIAAQAAAVARLDFSGARAIGEMMREDAKAAREEFDRWERRIMQLGMIEQATYSNEGRNFRRALPGVGTVTVTPNASENRGVDRVSSLSPIGISRSLQDALSAVDQTQIAQVERLRAALGELFSLRASGLGPDAGLDAAIQDLRDRLAELDPAQRQAAENQRRLNELLATTPSGQQGAVVREVEFINAAYDRGAISVEQWAELQRQATAKLPQDLQQAVEKMSESAKQFQRNVQDLLGNTISRTLRGDFEDIGQAWRDMLIDMAAQAAAANLGKKLFGADGKSGWFAALSSFAGFARGGVFAPGQHVTAFADGGILTRATPFMYGGGRLGVAGEAGPEAVLPLRRGSDGKLGVAGGGGTVVNYYVQAGVSRGELVAALQMSAHETHARVMRDLRAQRVV